MSKIEIYMSGHGQDRIMVDNRELPVRNFEVTGGVGDTTVVKMALVASELKVITSATGHFPEDHFPMETRDQYCLS